MISNREMKYVNAKVDNEHSIPYPGDNYSKDALLELKNSLYLYDVYYKNRDYDILFSNGDNLVFGIQPFNLSHILGVNFNQLRDSGIFDDLKCDIDKRTSYDLLNTIVENEDDIIKLNKLKEYSLLNFYRIKVRSEVFSKFSNFSEFNFGCINFDKDIASKKGYPTTMKSSKFLFTESDDPGFNYYMLGISNNEDDNYYVETMFPNNIPEKMFAGQEIVMPTVISTTTPSEFNKVEASASQKLRMVKLYDNMARMYNSKFSYFNDYYSTLSNQARVEERQKVLK